MFVPHHCFLPALVEIDGRPRYFIFCPRSRHPAEEIMPNAFWSAARSQMMLDPEVANLNTGSFGPLPRVVFERVTNLRRRLAEEPMDFLVRLAPPLLWEARQRLAQFLGGDPRRLIFTVNVTASVNIVAAALRLAAPGEILMTDHEYGAMHWCWERAAQRQGLTLRTFPLPVMAGAPEEIVEAAVAAFTPQTRLLFFSHVLSPTGLVLPARELCAEARKRGILTVIDGAHAPAMIDVDLDGLACDFYGANCHKWMLAPTGSGFLYFGRGSEERLQPLQVSWGWHYDRRSPEEPDEFGTTPRLRAYEFEGTRDFCPWLAVPSAIDFQAALGWARIRGRIEELVGYARERIGTGVGLEPATPSRPRLHGSMTAFRLPPKTDGQGLRRALWEKFRIEAPIIERPEGLLERGSAKDRQQIFPPDRYLDWSVRAIRVSTHFYNTEEEIDRLESALRDLLPGTK
jgi:isopenicillin-N epimerase